MATYKGWGDPPAGHQERLESQRLPEPWSMPLPQKFFTGNIPEPTQKQKKQARRLLLSSLDERNAALNRAFEYGDLWLIRELLTGAPKKFFGLAEGEKIDTNKKIMDAVRLGKKEVNADILCLVLDCCADIKKVDYNASAAAYPNCGPESLAVLLKASVDLNQQNFNIKTFLRQAVGNGQMENIRFLLSKNAAVEDIFLLNQAVFSGNEAVLREIISLDFFKDKINTGERSTALHCAAMNQWAGGIKILLAAGADPNLRDQEGKTPLKHCLEFGREDYLEIKKMLLDGGADPEIADNNQQSSYDYVFRCTRTESAVYKLFEEHKRIQEEIKKYAQVWKKTADDEIKHSYFFKPTGHCLTEVFNFKLRERKTFSLNLESKAEGFCRQDFDLINDKSGLEEAAAELIKQGGMALADKAIYAPVVIRHKRVLP